VARQMIEAKLVLAVLARELLSVADLIRCFDTAGRFRGEHDKLPVLVLKVAYLLRQKAV